MKIVCKGYRAGNLPEELRLGIDPEGSVTVTIVGEVEVPENARKLDPILAEQRLPQRSIEEIDRDLQYGRDDSDRARLVEDKVAQVMRLVRESGPTPPDLSSDHDDLYDDLGLPKR